MKIAFIDESYGTKEAGGAEVWTELLYNELKSRGNECTIYSYANGIDVGIPDKIKHFPYIREGFVYPYVGLKLIPEIERNYNILYFSSITTPIGRRSKAKTVVYANCLFSRQTKYFQHRLPLRYKPFFNTASYLYFKVLEAKSLRNVDRIVVPKDDVKRFMVEKLNVPAEKIEIICVGINTNFFKPPETDNRENIALFVGRGTIAKGFDTVLAAADFIDGKVIAVAQRVAGHYLRLAQKKKNFELIPRLNHDELVKLYQRAKVFILPSLSEGVPVTTLEAMSCGLPVVCSIEGGGEMIEDGENGYIVPFRDPESLAEKANQLFRNAKLANVFGRRNTEIIRNGYGIEHSTKKMLDVFNGIE
ncbi:glycosyltransferase family 4 protein [candidate division KSB1 bacterium]|nr:glycosyltransferase family 4 protein [candidate division KSB1 bacterium]